MPRETRFWDAVENENLEALAEVLEIDRDQQHALGTVLPTLSGWRRQDRWRYRIAGNRQRSLRDHRWKERGWQSFPLARVIANW